MDPFSFLTLCAASLATAAVSAVLGMAGGTMLLAVMLLFLEPAAVIPIHALVQLTSNASRTAVHARAVRRDLLLPYVVLLLPAGVLTVSLVRSAPAELLTLGIGVFVLVATWRPSWLLLGLDPQRVPTRYRFALVGAGAGALGPLVGAIGPFIAPFFLGIGLDRFQLIGTKAACQASAHLAKLLLFGLIGFAYLDFAGLIVGMAVGVVAGTWLGTRVLHHVDDERFVRLYRLTLTLVAIRLIWKGASVSWLSAASVTG